MIGGRSSLAGLIAAAGLSGLVTLGESRVPTTVPQVRGMPTAASAAKRMALAGMGLQALDVRRLFAGLGGPPTPSYPSNTGWTNRRYQRAALKRRNRIANRRNHRG